MDALPTGVIVAGLVFSLFLLLFSRVNGYLEVRRMRQMRLPVSERSSEDVSKVAQVYVVLGAIGAVVCVTLLAVKLLV